MAELQEYQNDIWRNANVNGFNEIFDALQADASELSLADLFEHSQKATEIDKGHQTSKLALLVTHGHQEKMADFYHSIRQLQVISSRVSQLFFDMQDALRWILDESPSSEQS